MNPLPPVSKNIGYDNNSYKNTNSNWCKNGDWLFLTKAFLAASMIATIIFFGGCRRTIGILPAVNVWHTFIVKYAFAVFHTAFFTWTTIGVFLTALPRTTPSLHALVVAATLAVWAFRIANVTFESHTTWSPNASIGTTYLSVRAFRRILTFFP